MSGFPDVFLRRPCLAVAAAVAALVAGVLSYMSLPVAFYPTVARPTISVTCSYPGANANEVMNTVAGPLEDRVNGVEGFDHMTSSCADTGTYSLTVYFQAGYDRDLALMKVQAAVQQALSQLPQEVKNTGVTVGVGQTIDLGYLTCYSERGELTRDEVVDYVFGVVDPAIMRVQGVGATSIQDEKLAIRIWLDSDRMAAHGISTDEVVAAVKAQNVQASLGTVGESPTDDPQRRVISLVAKGRLRKAEEFGAIIIRARADGVVHMRDIARVELGHEGYAHSGLFNDKPACVLHMYQLPGANTLDTVGKVKMLLAGLEKRFPGDLKWDMTVDVSRYSGSALRGAQTAYALAAAAAFVVLLLVFRSFLAALVPLIAAAVALSMVLVAMAVSGCFVTVLSLYALTAALAVMVGMSTAVMSACRAGRLAETRIPVLAAGAAVSAASLVLLLAGGVQGLILRQFAVVFAATGLSTSFVDVAIVPLLCQALDPRGRVVPKRPAPDSRQAGLLFSSVAVAVAMLLGAMALVGRMPRDLVPNEDFGVVLLDVKTRDGTSRPQVEEVVKTIRGKIGEAADIEKSCTVFGEGIFSPSGENVAKMYLVLKPWSERGPGESTLETIARIRAAVSDIPEAQVSLMSLPTVPGMGTAAYVSPLLLSTADNDPVRLADEAHRLQAILRRLPLADDVTCGYNTDSPHLRVNVDRAKCEMMNVPLSSLFATMQHYLGSVYVNDVNLGTQVNRVTVMSDWKGRSAPEAIAGLYVRSATGAMVPVSTLVDCEEELGPNAVYRYNRYLYCSLDVVQRAGVSLQDAMAEVGRVFDDELPQGYDMGWSGIAYEESSNPGRIWQATALSLLAVFLVLTVRFESWRKALLALLPTSAAVFGGVLALFASDVPLSLYSRFALVALPAVAVAFSLNTPADAKWPRRAFLPLLAAGMALPLVFTSGAGAAGSRSFGMTLLGGYLGYALLGGIAANWRLLWYNMPHGKM